jgi:hypothetical protein
LVSRPKREPRPGAEVGQGCGELPEWRNNEYGHKIACDLQKEGFTVSSVHQENLTANAILVGAKEPFELTRITPTGAEKGELGLAKFATFNLCAAISPS